ncbi:MAG: hypothetical protein ACJ8BW_34115 [Ktedonobacteraceae bacterium]
MMDFTNVIWEWARGADESALGAVNRPLHVWITHIISGSRPPHRTTSRG